MVPPETSSLIKERLETFRRNLLDTSLRNRLINFRSRNKAGKPLEKVIEIWGEDSAELYRILVTEQRSMSFVGKPDPRSPRTSQPTISDDIDDFGDPDSLAELREAAEFELDSFLDGHPNFDQVDLKLNTRETVSALQRKLTKISRDAKVSLEEQGVNVLFLALGMLKWFESDGSQDERQAPLLLVPVLLEKTNAGAYRLKWDAGEIGSNLSLVAKVQVEFGLKLPELQEEPELREFYKAVERAIKTKPRWSVERNTVALALFSYAKYLMYRDLDQAGWPEDGKPEDHDTLGALLDCGFGESEPGIAEDALLDPLRPVEEACEVCDADSSQTLAILEAKSGRTLLIEGPPGTGKSQTITNLIAEAIGAGKKVLFIAEKAAALDVVFRRLKEANLEDACLELHSNKTNKRSFYNELAVRWRSVGLGWRSRQPILLVYRQHATS